MEIIRSALYAQGEDLHVSIDNRSAQANSCRFHRYLTTSRFAAQRSGAYKNLTPISPSLNQTLRAILETAPEMASSNTVGTR